jgi:Zn finger protein HypA/HybF involved in hydrogenase expression
MSNTALTIPQFIDRATKAHGDKYDYSEVVYTTRKTAVKIICRKHGEFHQEPGNHLRGQGCPKCNIEKLTHTVDVFIKKANALHKNKYDYTHAEYVNTHTKVKIICPEHGEFWQTPAHHLQGKGCPGCAGNKLLSFDEFVAKANSVHQNKYTYCSTDYVSTKYKTSIYCKTHGLFTQIGSDHLSGKGCPACGSNKSFNKTVKTNTAMVYVVELYNQTETFYKVGITTQTLKHRLANITMMGYSYTEVFVVTATITNALELERGLKSILEQYAYTPSIYFTGCSSECFSDINPIKYLLSTGLHFYDIRPLSYMVHLEFIKHGYDADAVFVTDIIEQAINTFYRRAVPQYEQYLPDELKDSLDNLLYNWFTQCEDLDPQGTLVSITKLNLVLFVLKISYLQIPDIRTLFES